MNNPLKYSALTHPGLVRQHNEDFFLLPQPNAKYGVTRVDSANRGLLFVLCDGIGGANAGEVASELTATWLFHDYYSNPLTCLPSVALEQIIVDVNRRIFELGKKYDRYQGMGTTLVAVLLIDHVAHVYSVGDSRAYLLRNGTLTQLTEDHSEVWELYRQGHIAKDEIKSHPRGNIITCAIGMKPDLLISEIGKYEQTLKKKDLLVLCTDGLTDMVREEAIASVLESGVTLPRTTQSLVDLAIEHGGKDNITVVLVRV